MFPRWSYDFPELQAVNDKAIGGRVYITPQGNRYPSITTVTGHFKKKAIFEWRNRVGSAEANRISALATSRGTKVHAIAEQYIKGHTIELSDYDADVQKMYGFIKDKIDSGLEEVLAQETTLWSDTLKVAGRTDLIARWRHDDGRVLRTVVDFKTSMKPKKEEWITDYYEQAAAYACMFEEVTGLAVPRVLVIIAVADSDEGPAQVQTFSGKRNDYLPSLVEKIEQYHRIKSIPVAALTED